MHSQVYSELIHKISELIHIVKIYNHINKQRKKPLFKLLY